MEVFAFSKSLRCRPHSSSVRKTVLWDRFSDSFSPGEAILRRVAAAWVERKPVGDAVPGVPGDRKGRPYAIRTHRRGGALTRPPPRRGGKNPLPRGKRFCATRWAVQKDGRTTGAEGLAPVPLCHCEERSDVAISCTMYPIRLHRFTSYILDFRCEPTSHRIRLRRWRLPRLRLAMTR